MSNKIEPLKEQIIKLDKKLINKSEIARRLGVSDTYVRYLLSGKRKNDKLLKQILEIIKNVC